MENLVLIADADADRLPFGLIRMDAEGRVVAYNAQETALSGLRKADVLGKNFFRSVAPCTCVEQFEGLVRNMMASERPQREQIQFLFKFRDNATMVQIAITTDPWSGYATLLVRKSD
ncbi:MAG TPA: PAS domain-containing protein [Candidatus Binatia bacterium]|nr:PAS domain-containing protein [Candidatus Binatia bacterium]